MGLRESLFGGSSNRTSLYGPQTDVQKPFFERVGNLLENSDPNQFIAPLSPFTQAGFGSAVDAVNQMPGLFNTVQSGFGDFISRDATPFLSGLLSPGGTPSFSPAGLPVGQLNDIASGNVNTGPLDRVADAAFDRMTTSFNRDVMPRIGREFQGAGVGSFGSPKHQLAVGAAADSLQQNMGDFAANLYGNAFQQAQGQRLGAAGLLSDIDLGLTRLGEQGRQFNVGSGLDAARLFDNSRLSSLNAIPQLARDSLLPFQTLTDIGEIDRGFQQQQLNAPFNFLGNIQSLIGPQISTQSSVTNNGMFPGGVNDIFSITGNPFSGLFGG